jgi:CRP-like cAMP-binding protein
MSNFFWSKVFKHELSEVDRIAELWQQTSLFNGIPARHTRMLSAKMHVRRFQAEEVVFHQGDQAAGAILVLTGSVRIKVRNKELALLESGDFFGEIALAESEKRITDAIAIEDSRLVFFLKQDIEEWIDFEPRLGARFLLNLSSVLAHRLFEANKLLADEKSSY